MKLFSTSLLFILSYH